jgi:hypothetical protein
MGRIVSFLLAGLYLALVTWFVYAMWQDWNVYH